MQHSIVGFVARYCRHVLQTCHYDIAYSISHNMLIIIYDGTFSLRFAFIDCVLHFRYHEST